MNAHAFNQTATKRFCQRVSGGGIVWFLGRPETLLGIRNDEHVELLPETLYKWPDVRIIIIVVVQSLVRRLATYVCM